jgi:hypothetical protein
VEGDAAMAEEVQLIGDDAGLAVIGEPTAVERFLKSVGEWASSRQLDLRPLKPYLAIGADIAQQASEIAENSGRWIKLTEKSAALVKEHGFMASKQNADENHLMIPGLSGVGKWLQTEQDGAPLLANPAAVSTLSGILTRAATQQNMAEVVDYLKTIDHKLDDVLRKVDDAQVANMVGVAEAIERALVIREETGTVNETLWSTVDQSFQTIAATQAYALGELDVIAIKLEDTKVGDLARAAALAKTDVPKWLGVLAQCLPLAGRRRDDRARQGPRRISGGTGRVPPRPAEGQARTTQADLRPHVPAVEPHRSSRHHGQRQDHLEPHLLLRRDRVRQPRRYGRPRLSRAPEHRR